MVNPCWNSLIFQCVFLYVYIQCYQYSWYLAYANLLTYWLSYPKSRDAIASKNDFRCMLGTRQPQINCLLSVKISLAIASEVNQTYFKLTINHQNVTREIFVSNNSLIHYRVILLAAIQIFLWSMTNKTQDNWMKHNSRNMMKAILWKPKLSPTQVVVVVLFL